MSAFVDQAERKRRFIHELAVMLTENAGEWSIRLQMGEARAQAWARLRQTTPLFGYPTVEKAEAQLIEFLGEGGDHE